MPLWLEIRPANDSEWRALEDGDDAATLSAIEERARALIQCKIVTPDGVRIIWSHADERGAATLSAEAVRGLLRLG